MTLNHYLIGKKIDNGVFYIIKVLYLVIKLIITKYKAEFYMPY